MSKLQQLIDRCKHGIYLTVNEHRDNYMTAEQYLEDYRLSYECPPIIAPEVEAGIVRTDTLVELTCYPDTGIGSYQVVHYDAEAAMDEMLVILNG